MKKTIAITASILLSLLFLYAAINKLIIYPHFIKQLHNYPYFTNYANTLAWAVPSIEIIVALLLLYYRTRLAALYGSFILMLSFTIFIYWLTHFTDVKTCSCGGIISGLTWKQHLWFNGAFTALAGIGIGTLAYYQQSQKKQLQAS